MSLCTLGHRDAMVLFVRREYNTLSCTAGGKQLVMHGGHSRLHESVGRETAVLNLDSLTWEVPETAMQPGCLLGHSSSVVGRNKLLVFGGSLGEEASAAVQQLATDSMRWTSINPSSTSAPQSRLSHAAVALSDKVGVVGCAGIMLAALAVSRPNRFSKTAVFAV